MDKNFRKKMAIVVAMLMVLTACGSMEAISDPAGTYTIYLVKEIKGVAVFPFADYSHRESFAQALNWGGNERINEKIRSYLIAKGLRVLGQKEVSGLLVSNGMINLMRDVDNPVSFTWSLINKPHNPLMTKSLMKSLLSNYGVTDRLSRKEVIEMGRKLGVELIVRGKVMERKREPQCMRKIIPGRFPWRIRTN